MTKPEPLSQEAMNLFFARLREEYNLSLSPEEAKLLEKYKDDLPTDDTKISSIFLYTPSCLARQ
jgi:hypothetical protein